MNELVPDKLAYQINKRRMAWSALGMMVVTTIATLVDPARMAEAESVLMTQYIALSGLVGAYFALSSKSLGSKSE
tara:strand:- start:500 stop:724 length:225 start_codon:yes stop_codon:yes gene_type:complete